MTTPAPDPNRSPGGTCPAGGALSTRVPVWTRRRFLGWSGVVGAGALAVGATQVRWSDLVAAAADTPLDPEHGVLVVVTLYGGNDGLNTVVPASDPAYRSARGGLGYEPGEVLDLGEGLGLNPGMSQLHGLWGTGQLAVVRGVGYPKPDRSHFRSMAIWQTASPATASTTGWLGRWLDETTTDPLAAVSLDPTLPPLLAGEKLAAASLPLRGLTLPGDALGRAYGLLGRTDPRDGYWQARAARSVADLEEATRVLGPALSGAGPAAGNAASAGGRSELAAQLDVVATLVEMGVPSRAYSVSLGGFDTHSDERGTQQRLLTELDAALGRFAARLATTDRGRQVVTVVYSEFGRRVIANASDGTDHGTAGPVFVLGRNVQGGFHGAEPSLTDLDDGDLRASTDFRDVYGALLQHVLGADPGAVLGGWTGQVEGLLTA